MIIIEMLTPETLREASELANSVFPNEPVLPGDAFQASFDAQKLKEIDEKLGEKTRSLCYWVAKDTKTERIVGTTGLYEIPDDYREADWLGWFCVAPDMRGQNIGEKLLDFTAEQSKKRKKKFLRLYTSDHPSEQSAQHLYDKKRFFIMKNSKQIPSKNSTIFFREKEL